MARALVIGGTGPTGPHVLDGLLERGHDVTLFHRGVHEPPDLPDVPHIHGDPHFEETIREALAGQEFDIVLAMYGRLQAIADVLAGQCDQFICITGAPAYENMLYPDRVRPYGMRVLAPEDGPLADDRGEPPRFSALLLNSERSVMQHGSAGAFRATIFRYPAIYGPRNVIPYEWSVIRRIQDNRPYMLVTEGGLGITSRGAARNAAHALMLALDQPESAEGEVFNFADDTQYTHRQWIELVAEAMGAELPIRSIPLELGMATHAELNPMPDNYPHTLLDTFKLRSTLGYCDQVQPIDAIAEVVEWLRANPPQADEYPAYLEQFDYDAEDRLVSAYDSAIAEVERVAGRPTLERFHAMAHPKKAGTAPDQRSR